MSFDGIVTRCIIKELKEKLIGGKINKIYQPENNELSLNIYNKAENYQLIVSASSNYPRIGISNIKKENPIKPPMFCMLMRKNLTGGQIINIRQYYFDRIITIEIENYNDLGDKVILKLIVEIMGRHSNIILVNESNNKIIDSIYRVSEDLSKFRQVLPGLDYQLPPLQNKDLISDLNKKDFINKINNHNDNSPIFKFFYMNYLGLSPLISKEICFRANIDSGRKISTLLEKDIDSLYSSFKSICKLIVNEDFYPVIYLDSNKNVKSFYCLELESMSNFEKVHLNSMSEVIDKSYKNKNVSNAYIQKKSNLKKIVKNHIERSENKLRKQKEELSSSLERDKFRVYGDVLSANFHKIPKGASEAFLENFYDENLNKIKIPLDSTISPAQNADRFYKNYSKLKNAEKRLKKYIPISKHEILYLNNVLIDIEHSEDLLDLEEIKEELISEGYIQNRRKKKNKKRSNISKPHHYISSNGLNIFVGKNNRQNDKLTIKTANKDDLWLHVQNMPGSHVIIKRNSNEVISEECLREAALLAAYYSQARNSRNVPVDYTIRQNINKAKGAKPGMVYYNNFKTIFVNPSLRLINEIKKIN